MKKSAYFDAVVVGAGNVGLAFILAMAKDWQASLTVLGRQQKNRQPPRILLLERGPAKQAFSHLESSSISSTYSNRVSALTPKSVAFLQKLGVWSGYIESSQRFQPWAQMQVWQAELGSTLGGANGRGGIVFKAGEAMNSSDSDALAVTLENSVLRQGLLSAIFQDNVVSLSNKVKDLNEIREFNDLSSSSLLELTIVAGAESLKFEKDPFLPNGLVTVGSLINDDFHCRTPLVVGADGGSDESPVRKFSGISCIKKDYDQVGVVATLSHEEQADPMSLTAFQRFLASGPIALLPLDSKTSSMVWTLPTELGRSIVTLARENPTLFESLVASALNHHQSDISYLLDRILKKKEREEVNYSESDERGQSGLPSIAPPCSLKLSPPESVQCFPLRFRHCTEYDKARVVLIG